MTFTLEGVILRFLYHMNALGAWAVDQTYPYVLVTGNYQSFIYIQNWLNAVVANGTSLDDPSSVNPAWGLPADVTLRQAMSWLEGE